jgi:hypothetical protein
MTIDDLRIVNCSDKQRSSLEPPPPIRVEYRVYPTSGFMEVRALVREAKAITLSR